MKGTDLDLHQRKVGDEFKLRGKSIRVDANAPYWFCRGCMFSEPGKCKLTKAARLIVGECDGIIFKEVKA